MLGVATPSVFACSCVRQHPAVFVRDADAAIVGVVESRQTSSAGISHVVHVERAIKGRFAARVTVESGLTSCQVSLEVGARVGLILDAGPTGEWSASLCGVTDPDAMLAAGELPVPRGTARFVAAVDAGTTDAVALGERGKTAGYGLAEGRPLAIAPCGTGVVQAVRGRDGKVSVFTRFLPHLAASSPQPLPVSDVRALGCTEGGRTLWAIGPSGDQVELLSIRAGKEPRRELRRAAGGVAISGSRAYFAHEGQVRTVPLTGPRLLRSTKHEGEFAQLSVNGRRVAGRLTDGRAAVLDLRSGRLRTGPRVDELVWLRSDELLDAGNGTVLSSRLAERRRLRGNLGRVVAVDRGTAYLASGKILLRLGPGAKRARTFAELPGNVVALTPVRPTASAAAWHSCEQSAKDPLTT